MSLLEVAKKVGVSTACVSYVMNNRPGVSPETAEKVRQAAKELNYEPRNRKSASASPTGDGIKTGVIGLVFFGLHAPLAEIPLYSRMVHAVETELADKDLMMALTTVNNAEALAAWSGSKLDGALLAGMSSHMTPPKQIPFVSLLGACDPESEIVSDYAGPANERIGVMAAKYFLSRGHRRIAAIYPLTFHHSVFETRIEYFQRHLDAQDQACLKFDVPFADQSNVKIVGYENCPVMQAFVKQFKEQADRPTAIFVPADGYLVMVQNALTQAGIKVGQDVELLGCNNEEVTLNGVFPHPATIDINPDAIAHEAVTLLLERIKNGQAKQAPNKIVTVEPTLVPAGFGVKELW